MKNKKLAKFLLSFILSLTIVSFAASAVLAQPAAVKPGTDPTVGNIFTQINTIIGWFQGLVLLIGIVMIIWAGLTWMMAGGDAAKLGEARSRLIYGLIGIGVAILAYGAQAFVKSFAGI